MDIIERLQEVIAHEGLTVSAFARKIGVVDQTIRGIVVQKRNKPSFDILERIIQTFDWINAEWLLTGKGEMEKGETYSKRDEKSLEMQELIKYLREKDEKIEKLIEEKTELKIKFNLSQEKWQESIPAKNEK